MKAVIGTEDDVVGLGLTGIKQRIVLNPKAPKKELLKAVQELEDETNIVFINETLLRTHRDHRPDTYEYIMIPDHTATPDITEIETMAKETLGINIE